MYAIIGCSDCPEMWIVNTATNERQTGCPRCGRVYDRQDRTWLGRAETREQAAHQRGQLLERRYRGQL